METTKSNPLESIFASIDLSREDRVKDDNLAKMFTRITHMSGDFENVELVHISESAAGVDKEGKPADRYHVIWSENGQLYGAWTFRHDDFDDSDEILYPVSITTMHKKTRQIQEDVYYRDNLSLPIEWVTYHNAL